MDGGYQYFSQIYQDLVFEMTFLDQYAKAAEIPKAFDHKTKTFSTTFKDLNSGHYQDHITNLIARIVQLGSAIAACGPENNSFNYVELSKLLSNYVAPETGTLSGIDALTTMTLEALYNLERILDLKSQKPKSSAQEPSAPKAKIMQRKIKITNYFQNVLSQNAKSLGYDFLSLNEEDAKADNLNGIPIINSTDFNLRITQELNKYFLDDVDEFQINIDGDISTIDLNFNKYSYLTPSYVFLKDQATPKSLANKDNNSFKNKKFLEYATELILKKKEINGPFAKYNFNNIKVLFAQKGASFKISTPFKIVPEDSPINQNLGQDADDLTGNYAADNVVNLQLPIEGIASAVVMMEALNPSFVTPQAQETPQTEEMGNFLQENYLLASPNNAFAKSKTARPADLMRILPNQIKSLFLAGQEIDGTPGSELRFNPFTDGNPITDPISSFLFFFYYQNIVRVEYLYGYKTSQDGKKRNFLSSPDFRLLDQNAYNSLIGKKVLCRLVRYTKENFIKPFNEDFMELPFMNEYFFLSIGVQTAQAQAAIPTVYEVAKSNAKSMGQMVTPDVVITPPPEPTTILPPLTIPAVTPNTPGGGY
jgi:hypothetical protein